MHTFPQNYWTFPNLLYIHSLAHWTWIRTCLKIKIQVKHCKSMYSGTCLSAGKVFQRKALPFLHNIHNPLLLTRQTLAGTEGRHLQLKNLLSMSNHPRIRSQGESAPRMGPGKGGDSTQVGSLHSPGTSCSCSDHTATATGVRQPYCMYEKFKKPSTKSHFHKHVMGTVIQPGLIQHKN